MKKGLILTICLIYIIILNVCLCSSLEELDFDKIKSKSYRCPNEKCQYGDNTNRCLASKCECDGNKFEKCVCKSNNFYDNNQKIPEILRAFCSNYLETGDTCKNSFSCKSSCCSKTTKMCVIENISSLTQINNCISDVNVQFTTKKRIKSDPIPRTRTNLTVPNTFDLVPNITLSFPTSNKCWVDGTCANNPQPGKADVFNSVKNFNNYYEPIKIPGLSGIKAVRPNSPAYQGIFNDPNNILYECGDGTQECEYACCSYGFCIDPTNDCTPFTSDASFYSLYTFISLAVLVIVYWVLFWYFGVEYSKQSVSVHPDFSRDKIEMDKSHVMPQQIPGSDSKNASMSKDVSVKVQDDISSHSGNISLASGGIYPGVDDFSEKPREKF